MPSFRRSTGLVAAGVAIGICSSLVPCLHLPPARSQDLVGCQLTDEGQLQCVPGVSAAPQAQIRALRQGINSDLQLEGALQQQIEGLQQLVLTGETVTGQLLRATALDEALTRLPPSAFHWYRLPEGASTWMLISEATGPSYRLQAADLKAMVMLVVARPSAQGRSERQVSGTVGPIQPSSP
ncbi:MAG: hypothetical protein VKK98_08115 [Cyanobacteriota bacterium]|nr:hypothetical protein [Cyanobacteriota bacterium]